MRTDLIFVADLHLCHKAPLARSHEKDWYRCMAAQLKKLGDLVERVNGETGQPPRIVYCGDIFDRWNPSPELINFAIAHMPHGWAIPGNHDLPNHRYADMHRSGYGTLVAAGAVIDIMPGVAYGVGAWRLHPFPYGHEVGGGCLEGLHDGLCRDVAVIHAYVWTKGRGYTGAPEEGRSAAWRDKLAGFSHAFFGDNHKGFLWESDRLKIVNCGGFLRRTVDEKEEDPSVWGLRSDGSVERHVLGDGAVADRGLSNVKDFNAFFAALDGLGGGAVDFREVMLQRLRQSDVGSGVRERVLEAMGEV